MSRSKKSTVEVQGTVVSIVNRGNDDFISLTDIAKYKNPDHADDVIRNWLRNRNTLEFLGVWERLNNPDFNPVEFDGIKSQTGLNSFTLTPKQWLEKIHAIGIVSQAGRYGGTYAHKDIAFEFASSKDFSGSLFQSRFAVFQPSFFQKYLGPNRRRGLQYS